MLSERERRMLAQIEAHIRREEPALAHLLAHGNRLTLLRHPEPATVRALLLTAMTVAFGLTLFAVGSVLAVAPLVVSGLAMAMIGPLPVWMLLTGDRMLRRVRA
jgi:hypothetical protein